MTPVWTVERHSITGGVKLFYYGNNKRLSFAQVFELWMTRPEFAQFYTNSLSTLPYQAIRWEAPAVSTSDISCPFECVAIDAPELVKPANTRDFESYFGHKKSVVTFTNLGGDATLIVPCGTSAQPFAHLLSFLREAERKQSSQLWQTVGETMAQQLNYQPLWLNTSGDGVAWLHVRCDSRPKYYHYKPYQQLSFTR